MNTNCSVITDILPLYVEELVSEETATFVSEHLATCESCSATLAAMQTDTGEKTVVQPSEGGAGLKQVRAAIAKDRWLVAGLSTLVSLLVGLFVISYIATPTLVSYDKISHVLHIQEADGKVTVVYPDNFALDLNGSEGHYTVGLSQSMLQGQTASVGDITVVVNPSGEPVQTMVYALDDQGNYPMLYHNETVEQGIVYGGVTTLPRIPLAVYIQFALIGLVWLVVLVGVRARTRSWKHVLVFGALLPVSLVLGTMLLYLAHAASSLAPLVTVCLYVVCAVVYVALLRRRVAA